MEVEGLTIYHVKSHLQKYRLNYVIEKNKKSKRKETPAEIDDEGETQSKVVKTTSQSDAVGGGSLTNIQTNLKPTLSDSNLRRSISDEEIDELSVLPDNDVESDQLIENENFSKNTILEEELQKHAEMQKKLEMQLQAQRDLQLHIEQHGKYLQSLMEHQKNVP